MKGSTRWLLPIILLFAGSFESFADDALAAADSTFTQVSSAPAAAASAPASAAAPGEAPAAKKVRGLWSVDFNMRFDNREFDRAQNYFTPSKTLFATALIVQGGIEINDRTGGSHKIVAGVDLCKHFGSLSQKPIFRGIMCYYDLTKQISDKTELHFNAGRFPRAALEGDYSEAFISDSLRFERSAIEGIAIQWRRPKSTYEIGADWVGRPEGPSRERFMIFGSARSQLLDYLSIGAAAYMFHFAGSEYVEGVVDNILIQPWLQFDFGCMTPLERLSLRLGYIQTGQQDRVKVHKYIFPGGATADFDISKWGVFIKNHVYFGKNMMPYYAVRDAAGYSYGSDLYWGDPFYRTRAESAAEWAVYDKLSFGWDWKPSFAKWVELGVKVNLHFTRIYEGTSQVVTVRFNLDNFRK